MQTPPLCQPKRGLWTRARGLACCAIVGGLYLYATLHPQVKSHASSEATISHIIDVTEPLCRALVPAKDVLHFAAHPNPVYHRNGSSRDVWVVECRNSEGREMVHVVWDEDARRCISISQTQAASPHVSKSLMNKEVALSAARNWIGRLNIADPVKAANAPGELRVTGESYRVFLHLPDGLATVWIDAHSGECVNALVRSYPDMSQMQASSPSKEDVPHS